MEILSLSKRTVLTYLRTGQLPGLKLGKDWRIPHQALFPFTQEEMSVARTERHLP